MVYVFTLLSLFARPAAAAATPQPTVSAYDGHAINEVIEEHLGFVRACYELHQPAHTPGAHLRLKFRLAADGHVEAAQVQSDHLGAPGAARCVSRYARSWHFPAPGHEGTQFMYTFRFE